MPSAFTRSYYGIEVPPGERADMTWEQRSDHRKARREQSKQLWAWHKQQPRRVQLRDFSSRAAAEAQLAKVQPQVPDIPLHVYEYSYLSL